METKYLYKMNKVKLCLFVIAVVFNAFVLLLSDTVIHKSRTESELRESESLNYGLISNSVKGKVSVVI